MRRVRNCGQRCCVAAFFAVTVLQVQSVYAGMPMITYSLSEYGANRLIGISTALFVVGVLAALPIMSCWNSLVAGNEDARFLRKWSYPKALGFTFLSGILFMLILVMVAGSRELFSPGAWVPDGVLSKTVFSVQMEKLEQVQTQAEQNLDLMRRDAIIKLRDALRLYAKKHDGRLPGSIEELEFVTLWDIPFASGMRYEYFPNENDANLPLLREPSLLPNAKFSVGRAFEIVEVVP